MDETDSFSERCNDAESSGLDCQPWFPVFFVSCQQFTDPSGGMSQQHGVSPSLASIATAPPSHGTPSITTTITSAPSADSSATQPQTNGEASSVSQSSQPTRPSSTPSAKVHIPKLSAATTELLARVTGRLQGEPSPSAAGNDHNNFVRWMPPKLTHTLNNQNSASTMKASSTIIELPTAPFVYSHHMGAVAASPRATTTQQQSQANHTPNTAALTTLNSPGLVNIAPKPSGTPTPLAQASPPSQIQLPSPSSTSIPPAKTSSPASKPKKPARPSAGSRPKKGITNGAKRKKRKRGGDSDGEIIRAGDSSTDDDSDDVAPTATQTKSGRQVNRPSLYVPAAAPSPASTKANGHSLDAASDGLQGAAAAASRKRKRVFRKPKDPNSINCMHCQRGHSPLSNPIVFCDECNRAWHQLCHDPPIDAEVVNIAEKEWLCHECKPVPRAIVQPTVVRSNPHLGSSTLPLDPTVFPPTELPRLEVGGNGFSVDERRGFLSCLSHATLVEILLTLSSHNPILPLFPANLRSLPSSQFPCPPSKLPTTSFPSATATTPATNGTVLKPTPGPLPTPSSDRRRQYEEPSDDEGSEYEVEDHRLYPRAGNGFSLSANLDDLDIMREDSACPTFSYALHGPAKSRLQTNHPSPFWREPLGS